MKRTFSLAGAAGAAWAALAGALLWAQVPEPEEEPVPPEYVSPSEAGQIDEEKLDRFADAYIAVEEIQSDTQKALEAADDPREEYKLRADAEGKIIEAVERSGLKLEEFNRIAERMSQDRELRLKIADRVRQRRQI
ncbi:MAG TPA: DUF4168 domain-containing protein [Steroidobacter sp.]